MNKLVEKNHQTGVFPPEPLIRLLNNKWEQLFKRAMYKGVSSVTAHFIASDRINWKNLYLYSKYVVSRIKRKFIINNEKPF